MTDINEDLNDTPDGWDGLRITAPVMDLSHATPELYAALAQAQGDAPVVSKRGRHDEMGRKAYDYATADDMILAGTTGRAGTGLALFTIPTSAPPAKKEDYGKQWVCSNVTLHWVLSHSGGGYITGAFSGPALASAGRPRDKAEAAAWSYLEGFLERGLMRLSRASVPEDEEVDQRRDEVEPPLDPATHLAAFAEAGSGASYKEAVAAFESDWRRFSPEDRARLVEARKAAVARLRAATPAEPTQGATKSTAAVTGGTTAEARKGET